MNASNHTGELSGDSSSSGPIDPIVLFSDIEHVVIAVSGLAIGIFLTCGCFFLFRFIQNRRDRNAERLL